MSEARVLQLLESKIDGITQKEIEKDLNLSASDVEGALQTLKQSGVSESRKVGNTITWYPLLRDSKKKILVVEDDKNINNLMRIAVGNDYDVKQEYDGREAMKTVREFGPDLIILDLQLPGVDGLDICQTVKKDVSTENTTVIIVSAMDATKNRFTGIKYGADYYIRKPFDPKDLRSLVNIFLKKKGRKFDPLVDLPDEKRLTGQLEGAIQEENFEINNLKISNISSFERNYGENEAKTIIRLVSQIVQDKVRKWDSEKGFVGYIGNGEFIVAGGKDETGMVVKEVASEFIRVLPFIYQGKGQLDLELDDLFSSKKSERLAIEANILPFEKIKQKRSEVLGGDAEKDIGAYTYAQLQQMLGSHNVDITISRDTTGMKLGLSKRKEENK